MRFLVSGYYGFGNAGDEAVLQGLIAGLKERADQPEITVLSAAPGPKEKTIGRNNWPAIFKAMLGTDVFVSGGGTLLQNSTSNRSLNYYLSLIMLAKLMGKRVVVLGQGFGPVKGRFQNWLAVNVLKLAEVVALRDQQSYELLKRQIPQAVLAGDLAALMPPAGQTAIDNIFGLVGIKNAGHKLLGVALRRPLAEKATADLASILDQLVREEGYFPVFLLYQFPDDMAAASEVIKKMKENSQVIYRLCRPDELLAITAKLDLVVGMRLHSLIFAALAGVPAVGLAYDPKVTSFMNEIGQPSLPLNEAGKLIGAIDRSKITAVKDKLIEAAWRNFAWLKK